ncbi:Aminodeoxychorismate lyase [hydrothermal vent metagenome]|uniref:aminodeoxychorismate lyase n=1 Tax=hydrothermal vent metagenome TaxID=652676 RepID=A0A3B1B0F9_9ZZZZ
MTMLINGKQTDQLCATDRGLQYGDGLFETIAVMDGRCPFWDRHMLRLQTGCQRLQLPAPEIALLQSEALSLIKNKSRAVLKLIISRGEGGRGYRYPESVPSTRILMRHPWPDYPVQNGQQGVQLRFCDTTLARQPRLAGLKHLNRLEQVLARNEWQDANIAEGLMLDENGNVIEGTISNVFMLQNGILVTPDLSHCGVAGIMRERLLELAAKAGINIQIGNITKEQLLEADEIFISNSLIGLWPVKQLNGQTFTIGDTSRKLQMLINRDMPLIHV